MSVYVLAVEGLSELVTRVDQMDPAIMRATRMALNKTADRAKASASRAIRKELNFKASYISGADGKLQITTKATDESPEAEISARFRATSLARFAVNTDPAAARKKGGVAVKVTPGTAKWLPKAFLVKLKSGTDGSMNNRGLAMRLKPGDVLKNKKQRTVRLEGNLYLLYGPSVQQAFINAQGGGAAKDITPETLDFLEAEFLRLVPLEL